MQPTNRKHSRNSLDDVRSLKDNPRLYKFGYHLGRAARIATKGPTLVFRKSRASVVSTARSFGNARRRRKASHSKIEKDFELPIIVEEQLPANVDDKLFINPVNKMIWTMPGWPKQLFDVADNEATIIFEQVFELGEKYINS